MGLDWETPDLLDHEDKAIPGLEHSERIQTLVLCVTEGGTEFLPSRAEIKGLITSRHFSHHMAGGHFSLLPPNVTSAQ